MLTKLFLLITILSSGYAHAETKCEPKEEPKPAPAVEKADVHAPMDKHFLDRRPYMAPKKK